MSRLALAVAIILGATGWSPALSLEVLDDNRILWRGVIQESELFDVSFIHSAERCLWTQHYRAAGVGDIEQLASTFSCFGAGMPPWSTDGSPVRRTAEGYRVAAPARIGDLAMMAWRASDISLSYRGEKIRIGRWFRDFEHMSVRIR